MRTAHIFTSCFEAPANVSPTCCLVLSLNPKHLPCTKASRTKASREPKSGCESASFDFRHSFNEPCLTQPEAKIKVRLSVRHSNHRSPLGRGAWQAMKHARSSLAPAIWSIGPVLS